MFDNLTNQDLLIIICALLFGFGVVKLLLNQSEDSKKEKEEER
jgi:hypothetical protein